jgi:hypothetical protein
MRKSVLLFAALLLVPTAFADRVVCDAVWQTHYFTIIEDATISSQTPNVNFENDPNLKQRVWTTRRENWMDRFLIKPYLPDGEISRAVLRLYVVDNVSCSWVLVHRILQDWSASTVTWSNCPAWENTPLTSFYPPGLGYWAEADITGADSRGVLVRLANEGENVKELVYFASKENEQYAPYTAATWRPWRLDLSLSTSDLIAKPQIVVGADNEIRAVRVFTVANGTSWDADNVVVQHVFPENAVWRERENSWVGSLTSGGQYTGQVSYAQPLPMPGCVENRENYHKFRFFLPRAITPADTKLSIRVVIPQVVSVSKVLVNGVEVPFTVSQGSTVVVADASSLSLPEGEGFVEVYWSVPAAGAPAPTPKPPAPPPPTPPTPAPAPSPFIPPLTLFPLFLSLSVLALAGMGVSMGRYTLLGILVSSASLLVVVANWGVGIPLLAFGGLFFLDDLLIHAGVVRGAGFELKVGGTHIHHAYIGLSLLTSALLTLLGAPLVVTAVVPLAVLVALVSMVKRLAG